MRPRALAEIESSAAARFNAWNGSILVSPTPINIADAYESLIQFLYRAPIGLVQTALDGKVEIINPMSASLLMPLSRTGHLDNLFVALEEVAPELRQMVRAFKDPSGTVCESLRFPIVNDENSKAPQTLCVNLVKLDDSRLMAMVSDVTFEVQREHEDLMRGIDAAARIDNLTQMPTRAVVCELIDKKIARSADQPNSGFAIIYINCDRFKQINDTLGRATGDEVLGLMADRLRSTLRQYTRGGRYAVIESVAARMGGDEFVVVLSDLKLLEDVHVVTQRLVDVLGQPYAIRTHQLHCTVSMGVVLRPQVTGDAATILQDASIAMVEAKRAGGARYVIFEPAMQERAARRSGIESDLRRAIVQQELFVVYQPVVGLQGSSGEVDRSAGIEALVRWRHPTRGTIPPIEFIGVAEESGLISELGEFVLEAACSQFMQWQQQLGSRAPRHLAVNLSRGQLDNPGFVASVQRILHRTRMRPADLQLEITESLAAQDETVQLRLHDLKALGLTLALDDFGTGYSSLASLHLLPVDTIKIDRSFVTEAVTSAHHRVLIEATVQVAESLQMSTVAEGIETEEQAAVVQRLGCQKGQGYFFSKPLSAAEIVQWAGGIA
jgi:diguanylate cyclase (GGDEF)-like protein